MFLVGFVLSINNSIRAQESLAPEVKNQIGLQHDNDFFLLTDRYYSFGLFLNYKHRFDKGIFGGTDEQLSITLGEEAYTPDDTETTSINEMDRPYVGYLGLNSSWTKSKKRSLFEIQLELGIAGKASGAGAIQRWYHNAIVVSDPQSWVGEISDSFHVNLYLEYTIEWQLVANPFSVHIAFQPQAAYGTKDQYIQPDLVAFFGRRNSLHSSIGYGQIGSTVRELFFSLIAGYRFVNYNGLLEGNPWADNSVFLVDSNDTVLHLGFDFHHRYNRNDYRVGYRFNSEESELSQTHQYIILSYARSF